MTLKMQITDAGRAALVNAQNTGTLPVTIAAIGVTAQAFVADPTLLALPGQLKQLVTFSGAAVATDTIHVSIRDQSTDVYALRGFGLILGDGTLFAAYGQVDPILEKSAAAMMLLATDVIFADIDAASLTFGDTNFLNPPGTTDTAGVLELATEQESIDGADGTRAVSPKGLLAALNARLGAAAPTAFMKTLLAAASAAAARTVLGIKSAALKDEGPGNALDADTLDGQHGAYYRDYDNLQNVPGAFPPSAHNHDAGAITTGTLPVARGGTGVGNIPAGNYPVGAGTGPLASKTPGQVLNDIGAAPAVHSHEIAAVNGLTAALAQVATTAVAGKVMLADAATIKAGLDNQKAPTALALLAGLLGAGKAANNGYFVVPVHDETTGARVEFIVQFGQLNTGATASGTLDFPIPFPNACLLAMPTDYATSGTDANTVKFNVPTKSSVAWYAGGTGSALNTWAWFSIGW